MDGIKVLLTLRGPLLCIEVQLARGTGIFPTALGCDWAKIGLVLASFPSSPHQSLLLIHYSSPYKYYTSTHMNHPN
jgi:hypothetical protein